MYVLLSIICFTIALWALSILVYLIHYSIRENKNRKVEFFVSPTYMDDEDTYPFLKKN
jgi:hypothetical protein